MFSFKFQQNRTINGAVRLYCMGTSAVFMCVNTPTYMTFCFDDNEVKMARKPTEDTEVGCSGEGKR